MTCILVVLVLFYLALFAGGAYAAWDTRNRP